MTVGQEPPEVARGRGSPTPADDIAGATIVVTGAGSGIGEGITRAAARRGMRVVLADVRAERIERLATELRDAGTEALAYPCDVRDADAVSRLADTAYETFGSVRVLVNNAGVEATGYTWESAPVEWQTIIEVNLLGVFHGIRAFVPRFLSDTSPAHVVNLSSIAALSSGPPQQSAYIASKHAIQGLSECLYLELQEIGSDVHVHVVTPGPVRTRIFEDAAALGSSALRSRRALGAFVDEIGIDAHEAGEIIVRGTFDGSFWIQTHPEMQAGAIARRVRMLSQLADPELITTAALAADQASAMDRPPSL